MQLALVRRRQGYIVLLLLSVMSLLYLLADRHSEPYPAVIMPNFAGVPQAEDGTIALWTFRVTATADHDTFVDDGGRLLADLPGQYHGPTLGFLMQERPHLLGDWLRTRLATLTGRDDWRTVTFEHLRSRVDPTTGQQLEIDPGTTYVVTLP